MSAAGYDVTREYYINDAGNQIHNLALSLYARYQQAFGQRGYECQKMDIMVRILLILQHKIKEIEGDKYLRNGPEGKAIAFF